MHCVSNSECFDIFDRVAQLAALQTRRCPAFLRFPKRQSIHKEPPPCRSSSKRKCLKRRGFALGVTTGGDGADSWRQPSINADKSVSHTRIVPRPKPIR